MLQCVSNQNCSMIYNRYIFTNPLKDVIIFRKVILKMLISLREKLHYWLRLIWNGNFRKTVFAETLQQSARNLELIYIDWFLAEISLRSYVHKRALTDVLPKHGKTGDRSVISYEAARAICCKHWTLRVTHVQLRIHGTCVIDQALWFYCHTSNITLALI